MNNRIRKAQEILHDKNIDVLLLSDPVSIFYLTGLSLSAGKMLIGQDKLALFVDGRYLLIAEKKSPIPVFLHSDENFKGFFSKKAEIGFDASLTTYESWQSWKKQLESWGKEKGFSLTLKALTSPIRTLRMIKEEKEIAALRKSAELNQKGFRYLCSLLKEGAQEKELAKEFTIFCLKEGAEKLSFDPIIAFGENTSFPHHKSGDAKLKKNDLVLMDLGVVVDRYCSDMTRMVFFGKKDPELAHVFETVKKAQQKAISLCKPGALLGSLDRAARDVMAKEGLEEYFTHSLGHGVGIEIHEYPRIKFDGEDKDLVLQPGMVFTVEPGIYIPGKGGSRFEDTIVITPNGCENFYAEL